MSRVVQGLTVAEAKALIHQQAAHGGMPCPVCARPVACYDRRFNAGMARTLVWLVEASEYGKRFVSLRRDAPRFVLVNREHARMRNYGVIECADPDSVRTASSGRWRPTPRGILFVRGRIVLPKFLTYLFNEVVGQSSDLIGIADALAEPFDIRNIRRHVASWS